MSTTGYPNRQPPLNNYNNNQKNLVCAVCRDVYADPRILPCFHTFCLQCLEGLQRTHGPLPFPCPSCRKKTPLPSGGIKNFQVNFYITENELRAARAPRPRLCKSHGDEAERCECDLCEQKICIACKLTGHNHHECEDLTEPAFCCMQCLKYQQTRVCKRHEDEKLKFICHQCDQVICVVCKLTEHNRHDCQDITETPSQCRQSPQDQQACFEELILHIEKKLQKLQENISACKTTRLSLDEQIQRRHAALISAADKWRNKNVEDLSRKAEDIDYELVLKSQFLEKGLNALLQGRQTLHCAREHSSVEGDREAWNVQACENLVSKMMIDLEDCVPRLELDCQTAELNDEDIGRFIGVPVKVELLQ
ncbi:E3 ubiquitin-protein ligase TRIM56-like [Littorina saxatilis]|uniref:E3 ubiquitin-protein ligase TRIM56-like n=1 Tax=Littorina saxatilis TaxID=31220 RepID=UPI0038B46B9A